MKLKFLPQKPRWISAMGLIGDQSNTKQKNEMFYFTKCHCVRMIKTVVDLNGPEWEERNSII